MRAAGPCRGGRVRQRGVHPSPPCTGSTTAPAGDDEAIATDSDDRPRLLVRLVNRRESRMNRSSLRRYRGVLTGTAIAILGALGPAALASAQVPNPPADGTAPGAELVTTVLGWLK